MLIRAAVIDKLQSLYQYVLLLQLSICAEADSLTQGSIILPSAPYASCFARVPRFI